MAKNKKYMVILAAFVLSTALLAGCSVSTEGEGGLVGDDGVNASGTPVNEGQAVDEEGNTVPAGEEQAVTDSQTGNSQDITSVSGTLISYNADIGMVGCLSHDKKTCFLAHLFQYL